MVMTNAVLSLPWLLLCSESLLTGHIADNKWLLSAQTYSYPPRPRRGGRKSLSVWGGHCLLSVKCPLTHTHTKRRQWEERRRRRVSGRAKVG